MGDSDNSGQRPWFPYDSLVVVLVGAEQERFELHQSILCASSDFFKAALNGNFLEAAGTLTLPEQKPDIFRYFIYWLYTGNLKGYYYPRTIKPTIWNLTKAVNTECEGKDLANMDQLPPENQHRQAWELASYRDAPFGSLIALYILADVLQVQKLPDLIVSTLIHIYGHENESSASNTGYRSYWRPCRLQELSGPTMGINMAFQALPQSSRLRPLLVHLFCDSASNISYHCSQGQQLHPDFVVAVGEEFSNRWLNSKGSSDWYKASELCRYHEHAGDSCTLTETYLDNDFLSILD